MSEISGREDLQRGVSDFHASVTEDAEIPQDAGWSHLLGFFRSDRILAPIPFWARESLLYIALGRVIPIFEPLHSYILPWSAVPMRSICRLAARYRSLLPEKQINRDTASLLVYFDERETQLQSMNVMRM